MHVSTPADEPPDQYIRDLLANGPFFRQIELPLDLHIVDPRSSIDIVALAERMMWSERQTIIIVTDGFGRPSEWGTVDATYPTYSLRAYRVVSSWAPQIIPGIPAPGCILYVTSDHIRRVE